VIAADPHAYDQLLDLLSERIAAEILEERGARPSEPKAERFETIAAKLLSWQINPAGCPKRGRASYTELVD
jgi:hypothetical protein